jgi:hypothetical protein
VVFVFASIDVLYYIYRFPYIEPLLHPWDEADLIMVYDLSDVLLESVCHYFIKDFCICIQQGNWPVVLLFGIVFVWFGDESYIGFIK